jgi:hypothetical protein
VRVPHLRPTGALSLTASARAVEAQDDRPLPRPHRFDAAEGKGTTPLQEQAASANDDLVGVVGVLFIADVVEPTNVGAIACHHPVASRGREQATELRLPPQALGLLIGGVLKSRRRRSRRMGCPSSSTSAFRTSASMWTEAWLAPPMLVLVPKAK